MIMVGTAGVACRPASPSPESVLRKFLGDLEFGRAEQALASLHPDSRQWLKSRCTALRKASNPETSTPEPSLESCWYQVMDLRLLQAPDSVAVVSPPGDRVTLRIGVEGGQSAEVRMQRHQGQWTVDLLRTLGLSEGTSSPAPQAPANSTASQTERSPKPENPTSDREPGPQDPHAIPSPAEPGR